MSWEQRLREIVLAGGALAAMGCNGEIQPVGSGENPPIDAGNTFDAGNPVDATNFPFCCNANPDPCCSVLHCGELSDGTCPFPQEAGPNDAAADGDARD